MTHPLLILNPSSGRELADEAAGTLEAGLRKKYGGVRVVRTGGDGHAREGARAAAAAGCTRIFVGGGDGTVNEALNGVVDADALGRVRLGILPLGTGNDFATGLGIPPEIDDALAVLLEERELKVDVGVVNGRHFLNTSGGGYIAEVSVAVTPQLKTIAGRMAYLIGGAQALIEYEPLRATVTAEPGEVRLGLGLYAFAVCNSRLIGGGKLIAPEAIVDDGLLDLCLIEDMTAVEFVGARQEGRRRRSHRRPARPLHPGVVDPDPVRPRGTDQHRRRGLRRLGLRVFRAPPRGDLLRGVGAVRRGQRQLNV